MKSPIKVFSEWAINGKDEGMEKNHSPSVKNMLEKATKDLNNYKFIDAGCGNGWVVRMVSKDAKCKSAVGVDGSSNMIRKARKLDINNEYYCEDLLKWCPKEKVELVHSMEVFYYFEKPEKVINHIYNNWICNGGKLIMGIDYYYENEISHTWQRKSSINVMKLYSKKKWTKFFYDAGFKDVESWYFGKKNDWNGTLVILGVK
tara:strand:- start:475 stop:1083 length:609 start_codon:yes stop_codon:yes gene_type:complete